MLGRVSNLPTIWTNTAAAALLAATAQGSGILTPDKALLWDGTLLALSLMYLSGIFFNDVFDADWDKRHQNKRPIPQGLISLSTVRNVAVLLMLLSILLILALSTLSPRQDGFWPSLLSV